MTIKNKPQNNFSEVRLRTPLEKVQYEIQKHRDNIKLLLAHAAGERKISSRLAMRKEARTPEDDLRLLWTLRNLRMQINKLEVKKSMLVRGRTPYGF